MNAIIGVPGNTKCIWEDLALHHRFIIKHEIDITAFPNFDYYIILPENSYLNIPKLIYFLAQYDPTEPIVIHGKCANSRSLIMTGAARQAQITSTFNSLIVETDQIHGCNYLGTYRDNPCCISKDGLVYERMSVDAMNTYHRYLNHNPIFPKVLSSDNQWTLIISYFGLNGIPDNEVFNSRWSRMTLSLNQNLVIYCQESQYSFFYEKRKQYGLLDKTEIHTVKYESLPAASYLSTVDQLKFDPESNSQLYIYEISIFSLIEEVIKNNPFNSSHFAWINLNFAKAGLRNFELLDLALQEHRDKMSLMHIDPMAKLDSGEPDKFFGTPCKSIDINFITGSKAYFSNFCQAIQQKFLIFLKKGLGSNIRHLISIIYWEHVEWFQLYFGDPQQLILNYTIILKGVHRLIHQVIPGLRSLSYNSLGYEICQQIFQSYQDGFINIDPLSLYKLFDDYFIMAWWTNHKDVCRHIIQTIMNQCETHPEFLRIVQGNPTQLLKTTDYIDSLPNNLEKVVLSESELNGVDLTKKQVFIYGDYPVTSKSFILSNPVFRPLNLKVWKF